MSMKSTISLVIVPLSLLLLFLSAQVYAQDDFLKEVPKATPGNWEAPFSVWRTGVIDYIDGEVAIVDDSRFKFSDNIRFFRLNGKGTNLDAFSEHTVVTMVLAPDRKTIKILVLGELEETEQ